MISSAPEPQPESKAGAVSASAEIQPPSDARAGRGPTEPPLPSVPDHELLRCIGRGAYGAVWLARNVMGTYRAVKIVHRHTFEDDKPFEREFEGIRKYEPISRSHEGLVQVLHVGRNDQVGCFYYVMELADATQSQKSNQSSVISDQSQDSAPPAATSTPLNTDPLNSRVGTVVCTTAPLSEPDWRVTHPALWMLSRNQTAQAAAP